MATLQQQQSGPPYTLPTAQLGGLPLVLPDIPITASLLALFICSAATHMTIFQINRRREHKFVFSALLFGFSMARISALTMRIVWATHQTNTQIAIAAAILTQAGVVLLFIVNLFFAERILLAYHPRLRSFMVVKLGLRILISLVILMLIMVIIVTVHSLYTLDTEARRMDRDVQLFAGTFLAVLAFLPIPIVIASVLAPRSREIEKFGSGRLRSQVRLLLFTSTLLTLGAAFRLISSYAAAPLNDPKWFNHKAVYYIMNFVIELVVSFTYAISRFDKRFHIPDQAKQSEGQDRNTESNDGQRFSLAVQTETDVFGAGEEGSEGESTKELNAEQKRDSAHSEAEKGNGQLTS